MAESFDIEAVVAERVAYLSTADEDPSSPHLQALAVLIDACLSPEERAEGFAELLGTMLDRLSPEQACLFQHLATEHSEQAALDYLGRLNLA